MKKEILIPLMSIIIYTLIGVMFSYYILKDSIYFNSFIDKLDNDQIERMIEVNRKYAWVSLILNPILICIQINLHFYQYLLYQTYHW